MFTLRATGKLLKKMKASPEANPPASTGRLGDWYATILYLRPRHFVLCVSAKTLLPVIVPAADARGLPDRLRAGLGEVLRGLGVPPQEIARELAEMSECRAAKTASRQILGSMNDFVRMLQGDPLPPSLAAMALHLARAPCGPLGMDSPDRLTRELLGAPESAMPPRGFPVTLVGGRGGDAGSDGTNVVPLRRPQRILQLKVTLQEVQPAVWRRVRVVEGTSLHELSFIINTAMGWLSYHLYEFAAGTQQHPVTYGMPDDEGHGQPAVDSKDVTAGEVFTTKGQKVRYAYDFGDDWEHVVELEDVLPPDPTFKHPICTEGERACPPEDCGGPYGYAELLQALEEPLNEHHEELREWAPEGFDAEAFHLGATNEALKHVREMVEQADDFG